MYDLDKHIQEQRNLTYETLCRMFFEKLNELHVSDECLKAIPELFVPSCGKYYADSLVKIAIMGKETYGWGDSLYENLKDFEKGKSINSYSETYFRTEGPSEWRNTFWQYFAEVLALMYDVDVNSVLEKDSPIINSIAWNNCHAIETYDSGGVDQSKITPDEMNSIQEIAFDAGITNIDNFIDVFKPQVILYLYRNEKSYDSYRPVDGLKPINKWGKDGFLHEYIHKGVVILH